MRIRRLGRSLQGRQDPSHTCRIFSTSAPYDPTNRSVIFRSLQVVTDPQKSRRNFHGSHRRQLRAKPAGYVRGEKEVRRQVVRRRFHQTQHAAALQGHRPRRDEPAGNENRGPARQGRHHQEVTNKKQSEVASSRFRDHPNSSDHKARARHSQRG